MKDESKDELPPLEAATAAVIQGPYDDYVEIELGKGDECIYHFITEDGEYEGVTTPSRLAFVVPEIDPVTSRQFFVISRVVDVAHHGQHVILHALDNDELYRLVMSVYRSILSEVPGSTGPQQIRRPIVH